MRMSTWNINGLRSGVRAGFEAWLAASKSDLVCLQEVKTQEDLLTRTWFNGYETYWNTARKTGYSGVATLVGPQLKPLWIGTGIGDDCTDSEGRVLSIEFDSFLLVNTYAPHSHRKLTRLGHKRSFCRHFLDHLRQLRRRDKPIVIVGDLNVAYQEIDLSNASANRKNAGFLPEEREWFGSLLNEGLLDAFRIFHSGCGHYTWWSMRRGVRERNVGWRLDYILVDSVLKPKVRACFHWTSQRGSDHCPVTMDIDL
ncbi:MAG: exodeoxyribonuclease III [Betaproteobacteria bacterium RIFCSPLOWO2_12_FULL_62_13]|nr:MAG: exodeoxyribonuclease III [Betaproteobacteria bacterium RIFCSPLOWO2_12_FULL_62_13]